MLNVSVCFLLLCCVISADANGAELRELQATYHGLVGEVQVVLDAHALQHQQQQQSQPQSRSTSPSFLTGLSKPKSRNRSNTNPQPPSSSVQTQAQSKLQALHAQGAYHFQHPHLAYKQLASTFYTINSKYRISWECAELLIDLAGGSASNNGGGTQPSTSVSAPVMGAAAGAGLDLNLSLHLNLIAKKGRERAITLAGDESTPSSPVMGAPSPLGPGTGGAGGDAVTRAANPPLASPPSLAWRASTGRHDLSHRQLVLLREMLHNADSPSSLNLRPHAEEQPYGGGPSIPEEQPLSLNVNREWRWGDAMSSTVTLPSEESGRSPSNVRKKHRHSRLGMSGLRDMLRSLKRQATDAPPLPALPVLASSTSLSTENSSLEQGGPLPPVQGRRRAKTSSGADSGWMARPTSPYSPSSLASKPSPRRPSLASIFRIGHKNKQPPALGHYGTEDNHPPRSTSSQSKSASSGPGDGDEDWDRLDSASDLDAAARALGIMHDNSTSGLATVRGKGKGKSPYLHDAHHDAPPLPSHLPRPLTPKRSASASQSSLRGGGLDSSNGAPGSSTPPSIPGARSTRLSNVEEHSDGYRHPRSSSNTKHSKTGVSPSRSPRDPKSPKNGSVRSMPPHPVSNTLPDPKLEMTPENIKPLLENAKEVQARLNECIAEIRSLLRMHADPRIHE
jgi:serine/arginine repetitive matrix protein 2